MNLAPSTAFPTAWPRSVQDFGSMPRPSIHKPAEVRMVVSVRPLKHAPTILFAHARVMLPARDSTSDNVVDFACAKLAGIQTVIQVRVLWEAHSVHVARASWINEHAGCAFSQTMLASSSCARSDRGRNHLGPSGRFCSHCRSLAARER